ncbi:MAG: type II toxin-antitoxin system VapC family toxin [Anaerolineales bacterium]|nr:type II toxin-antitoxin system VapC family toxin [Anaerolineales bacterium]
MNCTIDASVFVAAGRAPEPHHKASIRFLRQIREQGVEVFCPTLVLTECAAAVARQTGKPVLAERVIALLDRWPNLRLIPLDEALARQGAQIAITHRLRGSDAVYVAVAKLFQATLIAWDAEILERVPPGLLLTLTPTEWMEQLENGI